MFNAVESHEKILIDGMKCLRVEYLYNECSLCIDICPEEAITLGNNKRVALDTKKCIDCSACIGVCPTSAISNTEFDPNMFVLTFSTGDEKRISCKDNTPCLNIFNVEQLISLGLRNESIVCDMSHCKGCEINKNGMVEASIKVHIDEANTFLEVMGEESRIISDYEEPVEVERRQLFSKFAKGINELQSDVEIGEIFNESDNLPVHRQLLQNSLKRVIENVEETTLPYTFSFTANKQIDFQSCSNCGECVQFCPTDALTYSSDKSRILFQNLRCIACSICDDICKPRSFSDKPELDLVTMAFDRAMIAIEHRFVVCDECKTAFPQKGDEMICNRCIDFVNNSQDLFALARDLGN
ncbi:MAG: 4Fe-4S dicluster domain-containing protein [Campylobacterota bacterium]|nr:4Fe-4S dicluster domain-containing protein [Campylobacterota bacterium]